MLRRIIDVSPITECFNFVLKHLKKMEIQKNNYLAANEILKEKKYIVLSVGIKYF